MSTFAQRFRYSMDCAGLPTPSGVFDTVGQATANVAAMAAALKTLGASATVGEILGTAVGVTLAADVAIAVAGVAASYYVGACIGALIFAASGTFADSAAYEGTCSPSDLFGSLSSPVEMQRMAARFNIQAPAVAALALASNRHRWMDAGGGASPAAAVA